MKRFRVKLAVDNNRCGKLYSCFAKYTVDVSCENSTNAYYLAANKLKLERRRLKRAVIQPIGNCGSSRASTFSINMDGVEEVRDYYSREACKLYSKQLTNFVHSFMFRDLCKSSGKVGSRANDETLAEYMCDCLQSGYCSMSFFMEALHHTGVRYPQYASMQPARIGKVIRNYIDSEREEILAILIKQLKDQDNIKNTKGR